MILSTAPAELAALEDAYLLAGMLRAWESMCASRSADDGVAWVRALAGMAAAQDRIVAAARWTQGPSSLMAVLDLTRREVANCRVIRWLLDPLARHGLGARFIDVLGRQIGLELADSQRASSKAEVSQANSRADVVIRAAGGDWTVVIEAKVDAAEGGEQAARLEKDWPEAGRLVFLTTGGTRIPWTATDPTRWCPVGWDWFAATALRLLDDTESPTDERAVQARHAVAEWAASTRRDLR